MFLVSCPLVTSPCSVKRLEGENNMHGCHNQTDNSEIKPNAATPDVYEVLYRKLLEPTAKSGSGALAALLEGVLTRLVAELTGPNKETAIESVFDCQTLFTQAADALRLALDVQTATTNHRLEFLESRFELQLEQVQRCCLQAANQESTTYLDRMNLKHVLHQLLQTVRAIVEVEPQRSFRNAA